MNIYCGNNRLAPELQNGSSTLGTRHQCLKKGFGIGLHKPVPPGYRGYEPIDTTKYFCGNGDILPDSYDLLGSPSACLRKGIGAGMAKAQTRGGGHNTRTRVILYTLSVLVATVIIVLTEPSFLREEEDWSWEKLVLLYVCLLLVGWIIIRS